MHPLVKRRRETGPIPVRLHRLQVMQDSRGGFTWPASMKRASLPGRSPRLMVSEAAQAVGAFRLRRWIGSPGISWSIAQGRAERTPRKVGVVGAGQGAAGCAAHRGSRRWPASGPAVLAESIAQQPVEAFRRLPAREGQGRRDDGRAGGRRALNLIASFSPLGSGRPLLASGRRPRSREGVRARLRTISGSPLLSAGTAPLTWASTEHVEHSTLNGWRSFTAASRFITGWAGGCRGARSTRARWPPHRWRSFLQGRVVGGGRRCGGVLPS